MFPHDATDSDVARSYSAAQNATLIRGVRVFDGTTVLDANSVLVRDGLIVKTGTDLPGPDGVEVVEGAGGTLLPGLIDAHTHTVRPAELRQALAFGITTELDMFCVPSLLGPLREAAAERSDVADIRSAGIGATAGGGHPTQLVETGVYPPFPTLAHLDEAAAFVAARRNEGSDYFKILVEDGSAMGWNGLAHLDPETVTALAAASHAHQLRAVAHISTQEHARQAVSAGVDGLAHLFVDQPADPRFVQQASRAGIFAIPTLTIFEQLYDNHRRDARYRDHHGMWPYLEPEMRTALLADWRDYVSWQPPRWASARHTAHATRLLHQAGVPILAGTDVAAPRAAHGLSLHSELAALVDAGLSATEALTAATSNPADVFALPERGRIAPGLRADLLLVAGDPTRDITASAEIAGTWRRGRRFDREAYRANLDPTSNE